MFHDTDRAPIRNGPTLDELKEARNAPDKTVTFVIGTPITDEKPLSTGPETFHVSARVTTLSLHGNNRWLVNLDDAQGLPEPFKTKHMGCFALYIPPIPHDVHSVGVGTFFVDH